MTQTVYERLQTLAKKEFEQHIKKLDISEVDEILYQSMEYMQMNANEKQKYIARKVFRPVIQNYVNEPEKGLEYLQRTCGEEMQIDIEVNTADRDLLTRILGEKKAVGDILTVHYQCTDSKRATVYGFVGNKETKLDCIGKHNPNINIVDLSNFFAGIYLYRQVRQELERLAALPHREMDSHYQSVECYFKDRLQVWNINLDVTSKEMQEYCKK